MMNFLTQSIGETGVKVLLIGLMFLVFYFFMLRPKQKEANRRERYMDNLKKGTPVVSIGGIHGTVEKVEGAKVTILIDKKGSTITLSKQAVSVPQKSPEPKDKQKK